MVIPYGDTLYPACLARTGPQARLQLFNLRHSPGVWLRPRGFRGFAYRHPPEDSRRLPAQGSCPEATKYRSLADCFSWPPPPCLPRWNTQCACQARKWEEPKRLGVYWSYCGREKCPPDVEKVPGRGLSAPLSEGVHASPLSDLFLAFLG